MALPLTNEKIQNLFVVDWKTSSPQQIDGLLAKANLPDYKWSFYNCHSKNYAGNRVVNRYISYVFAVLYILKNKRKYDNIVIWQQMIGFMLCLLPRFSSKPKIIISTLLYSPSRVKAGSFRFFLLKNALKKADALLYFSDDMAHDVRNTYPIHAKKVFSTYLPISTNVKEANLIDNLNPANKKENSVFSGGLSDRDFDTVLRAFMNTNIPVTIVCSKTHVFRNPEFITDNFTIQRDVSTKEYYSLILSSTFAVVPLKNEYSSCGQILFAFCMKNGIPIIATDCYGTRDYISNNDNGILVPVKDDRAIFNAYQKLVGDIAFREKMVARSKDFAAKMTFDNYLYKLDTIIQQIQQDDV